MRQQDRAYCSHSTDAETEAWRGELTRAPQFVAELALVLLGQLSLCCPKYFFAMKGGPGLALFAVLDSWHYVCPSGLRF